MKVELRGSGRPWKSLLSTVRKLSEYITLYIDQSDHLLYGSRKLSKHSTAGEILN